MYGKYEGCSSKKVPTGDLYWGERGRFPPQLGVAGMGGQTIILKVRPPFGRQRMGDRKYPPLAEKNLQRWGDWAVSKLGRTNCFENYRGNGDPLGWNIKTLAFLACS